MGKSTIWSCSIATLNYQRVSQIQLNMSFPPKLAALLLHIYFLKKTAIANDNYQLKELHNIVLLGLSVRIQYMV